MIIKIKHNLFEKIYLKKFINCDIDSIIVTKLLHKRNFNEIFHENEIFVFHDIVINIRRQLLNALKFFHKRGIVHIVI